VFVSEANRGVVTLASDNPLTMIEFETPAPATARGRAGEQDSFDVEFCPDLRHIDDFIVRRKQIAAIPVHMRPAPGSSWQDRCGPRLVNEWLIGHRETAIRDFEP